MGHSIFLVVVAIAALNLVLDFDYIEQGAGTRCAEISRMVWSLFFNGYSNMALS